MNVLKISSLCLLATLLTACNSGGNNDSSALDTVLGLGTVSASGDPVQILDPQALKQDIASLFGNADDTPLAVECGATDTLQAVINRKA